MDVYYTDSNDNIRFVSDIKTPNQNIGIVGKVAKALVKELTGKPAEIVETKVETGGKEDIYSITNNLTGNSVGGGFTKADLLKSKYTSSNPSILPYSEETLAMQKNASNLYVQDYTGVNPVVGNINSAQGAGTKMK